CLLPFERFVNYPLLLLNFNFLMLLIVLFYDVSPLQLSLPSLFRKPAFWITSSLLAATILLNDWREEAAFHRAISWRSAGMMINKTEFRSLGLYEKNFCNQKESGYFF